MQKKKIILSNKILLFSKIIYNDQINKYIHKLIIQKIVKKENIIFVLIAKKSGQP